MVILFGNVQYTRKRQKLTQLTIKQRHVCVCVCVCVSHSKLHTTFLKHSIDVGCIVSWSKKGVTIGYRTAWFFCIHVRQCCSHIFL